MRNYRFTLYVWHDEETDSMLETDSLREVLKNMWKNRKHQFSFTWNKSRSE